MNKRSTRFGRTGAMVTCLEALTKKLTKVGLTEDLENRKE